MVLHIHQRRDLGGRCRLRLSRGAGASIGAAHGAAMRPTWVGRFTMAKMATDCRDLDQWPQICAWRPAPIRQKCRKRATNGRNLMFENCCVLPPALSAAAVAFVPKPRPRRAAIRSPSASRCRSPARSPPTASSRCSACRSGKRRSTPRAGCSGVRSSSSTTTIRPILRPFRASTPSCSTSTKSTSWSARTRPTWRRPPCR